MPIRINLLAETLADEELRRRDPVKRAIYIGAFLVVLSLVWFSSVWLKYMVVNSNMAQIQKDIESHTNEYAEVTGNLKKITDSQKRLEALQKLSDARFLQGNLLNAVQQIYVPNVQLTRIKVDQSYVTTAAAPGMTNISGTVIVKPATAVEKMVLTFDAKDFSANPGDQVNHYKDGLIQQSFFKSHLGASGNVRLLNLTPPQSAPDSKPFVLFTLECRFPDKTR